MLTVASRPQNLVHNGRNMTVVESDVYNICERIRKEISPDIVVRLREGHEKPWVLLELCRDGEERYISSYEALDQRVIDDLRYMLAVPFAERLAAEERKIEAANAERSKGMSDESFERFAWEMQRSLVESNLSNPTWTKNTPLAPKKA